MRFTPSPKNFDARVIGYYERGKLMYAARTRNGFTPASRAELFKKIKPLEIADCPFAKGNRCQRDRVYKRLERAVIVRRNSGVTFSCGNGKNSANDFTRYPQRRFAMYLPMAVQKQPKSTRRSKPFITELSPSVQRINYEIAQDWSGQWAIFFRVLLSDEAASRTSSKAQSERMKACWAKKAKG
jgi:hypothetical protein